MYTSCWLILSPSSTCNSPTSSSGCILSIHNVLSFQQLNNNYDVRCYCYYCYFYYYYHSFFITHIDVARVYCVFLSFWCVRFIATNSHSIRLEISSYVSILCSLQCRVVAFNECSTASVTVASLLYQTRWMMVISYYYYEDYYYCYL